MQRSNFDRGIEKIDDLVLTMARSASEALGRASHSLMTQDLELAKSVKKGDKIIDSIQSAIEELVVELIATQQPVATDLRHLMSVMKLASDFERAGDYAVHLAKATKLFFMEPAWRQFDSLKLMSEKGQAMIEGTARAYKDRDSALARRIAAMDDEIDHCHKALLRDTLSLMQEHPHLAERAAKIITISGFLERLGDHMTNACEAIVFIVEGTRIELND
jgi:phosphate transport system protein